MLPNKLFGLNIVSYILRDKAHDRDRHFRLMYYFFLHLTQGKNVKVFSFRNLGLNSENLSEEEKADERLLEVFKQNCLYIRHIENELMWFTNMYAIVSAIVFVFLIIMYPSSIRGTYYNHQDYSTCILLGFQILSSFIAILIAWKLSVEHYHNVKKTEDMLVEKLHVDKSYLFQSMARYKKSWIFRTATITCTFYSIMIGLCLFLLHFALVN